MPPADDHKEDLENEEQTGEQPPERRRPEEPVWVPPPDLEPLHPERERAGQATPPDDEAGLFSSISEDKEAEPEVLDVVEEPDTDAGTEEIEEDAEAVEVEDAEGDDDEYADDEEDEEDDDEEEDEEEDEQSEETVEGEEKRETPDGEKPGGKATAEKPKKKKKRRKPETPPVQSPAEAKSILECLLFATVEPLSLKKIRTYVHPMEPKDIQTLLVELQQEYANRGGGLQIVEVAGGFQMATNPRYADWLEPLYRKKRKTALSPAMLETLAIVSYKQPIIRAEVDAIRGVDSSGIMRALQDLNLVEVVGQKQVPGRPNLYGTTQAFLKYFGLKSLSDLPSIDSLREQFQLSQKQGTRSDG